MKDFVELVEVERGAVGELDVDHGAHGEGGEHLVRGLHGEDGGAVFHVVRDAHREASPVDRVELGVGVPGLVEVDAGDGAGELLDDLVDVVAEAVVGGVGDHGVGGVLASGRRWRMGCVAMSSWTEFGEKRLRGTRPIMP